MNVCRQCGRPSEWGLCQSCHTERTSDHVKLLQAEMQVMQIEQKYGIPTTNGAHHMKKVQEILKKHNFNFAWGANEEGERLKQMVLDGIKRHGFKDVAPYIRHCIKDTSLREGHIER